MSKIYKYNKGSFQDKLWNFIYLKTNIGINFIRIKWFIKYGTCNSNKVIKIKAKI